MLPGVDDAAWEQAVAALHSASDVTLVCHVAPDGDALGSMLALGRGLRGLGKRVTCTWGDDPWKRPASYEWLPDLEATGPPASVTGPVGVLVVLDTASIDRLGVLAGLVDRADAVIVVDHHAHNSGVTGIQLVDDNVAATAVLTAELLDRLGVALDETTATLLYVGLVTDTGSFQHSVTSPDVHALAGRLLAAGVRPAEIAQQLWGRRPFGFQRLLAAALSRARLEPDALGGRGLVWTWTSTEDLVSAGVALDEAEPVIDVVRTAREADVAVVCKQAGDATYRVSVRSRGDVDVGAACIGLGGGGHRLAAGFTSYDDVDTTVARLRTALDAG